MARVHINRIEDLLDLNSDTQIINHQITPLTAPGENYGSIMVKVDIIISTSKGNEEIHAVAKLVPLSERTRALFNTERTFINEIAFYKEIAPMLQNFQREHGVEEVIDFFPQYYGSRLNLNGDACSVDSDAVLLLENLKIAGFNNLERTEGLSLDVARLVLTDLALFHAVTLAFRLQKSEHFETKIKPYLSPWKINKKFHDSTKKKLDKIIQNIPEIAHLRQRILDGFDKKSLPSLVREPFATVIHNDCWVNNNMVRLVPPVKNKMVDFQECALASPGKDVIFFLFSSVKDYVLEKHYDDLVRLYYMKFTSTLKELGCNIEPFSLEALEKELSFEAAHSQFGHIVFMLYPIFVCKENVVVQNDSSPVDDLLEVEPTELHKKKLVFVVQQFAKRNWI